MAAAFVASCIRVIELSVVVIIPRGIFSSTKSLSSPYPMPTKLGSANPSPTALRSVGILVPGLVYALERVDVLVEPEAMSPGTGGYAGGVGKPVGSGYVPVAVFGGRANDRGGVVGGTTYPSPYSSGTVMVAVGGGGGGVTGRPVLTLRERAREAEDERRRVDVCEGGSGEGGAWCGVVEEAEWGVPGLLRSPRKENGGGTAEGVGARGRREGTSRAGERRSSESSR